MFDEKHILTFFLILGTFYVYLWKKSRFNVLNFVSDV